MAGIDFIHQNGVDYEIVPEIAPLFKTTVPYYTGDHVIYEAGWYTFKADNSAGAWDATKLDGPFKVSEQLINLKEDLRIYSGETEFMAWNEKHGVALNGSTANVLSPVSVNTVDCAVISCLEGDEFLVTAQGSSTYRWFGFVDADGNVLVAGTSSSSQISNRYVIAPKDAKYLVVNAQRAGNKAVYIGVPGKQRNAMVASMRMLNDSALSSAFKRYAGAEPIIFDAYDTCRMMAIGGVAKPFAYAGYISAKVPYSAGDKFALKVKGGSSSYRAYGFLDSSDTVLSVSSTSFNGEAIVTAPTNAAYLVINHLYTDVPTGFYAVKIPVDGMESIHDEVVNTSAAVSEITTAIGHQDVPVSADVETGYYWNAETNVAVKTSIATWKVYGPVSVEVGETYRVDIFDETSTKQYPVIAVDDDYNIISTYGTRSGAQASLVITVPDGATKLLATCKTSLVCKFYHRILKPVPENVLNGTFEYKGKNVAIIGDSISTNGDYSETNPLGNVPEIVVQEEDIGVELSAYVTYYDVGTTIGGHTIVESDVGTELTFTPVSGDEGKIIGKPKNNNVSTTDTWWEVASKTLGFNAIPVCWSGSSITDHEENVAEDGHYIYKCAHAWHESQIRKCGIRTPGTMTRTAPDMIIICRGTNDLSHSPYSLLTDDLDTSPTVYPETDTFEEDGVMKYSYVKGMRLLISKLREAYPEAKIVLCTLNYFRRLSTTAKYTSNGRDNWLTYNAMIRKIADYEGCELIEFDKDGLNWANAMNGYYNEGTSATAKWTHPNSKGHARLGSRALVDMRKVNDMTVPT